MSDNQSPDVYPLGQGGGLLKDVLNFALNNMYQYGQKLGRESQSNAAILNRMRAGDPSARVSTAANQPILGPNIVGQITPSNWQALAPEAKAILTETFNKFPRLFQRVQNTPSSLHVSVQPAAELAAKNASGVMRSINPYFDEIQLGKTQRVEGLPTSKTPVGDAFNWRSLPADEMRPDLLTAVHELQHHVNAPNLMQKSMADSADQATIGMLLKDIMYNKDIGSLQNRVEQYKTAARDPSMWNMQLQSPHSVADIAPGVQNFQRTPWPQFLGGAMADEGLAYLANHAAVDPSLAPLAEKLGVNPGFVAPQANSMIQPKPSLMDEVWSSINAMRDSGGQ